MIFYTKIIRHIQDIILDIIIHRISIRVGIFDLIDIERVEAGDNLPNIVSAWQQKSCPGTINVKASF